MRFSSSCDLFCRVTVTLPLCSVLITRIVNQKCGRNALNTSRRRDGVNHHFVHAVLRVSVFDDCDALCACAGGACLGAVAAGLRPFGGFGRRHVARRSRNSGRNRGSACFIVGSLHAQQRAHRWIVFLLIRIGRGLIVVHVHACANRVCAHNRLQRVDQPISQSGFFVLAVAGAFVAQTERTV